MAMTACGSRERMRELMNSHDEHVLSVETVRIVDAVSFSHIKRRIANLHHMATSLLVLRLCAPESQRLLAA